jgi:glutathionyl-hydroquinone reductase
MGYSSGTSIVMVANRTLIVRELKGLQDIIGKTVVDFHMGENGWRFPLTEDEVPGAQPDRLYGSKSLREIYFKAVSDYEGRFTVPVLWDKKTETIVNNESRCGSHRRG